MYITKSDLSNYKCFPSYGLKDTLLPFPFGLPPPLPRWETDPQEIDGTNKVKSRLTTLPQPSYSTKTLGSTRSFIGPTWPPFKLVQKKQQK